MTDRHAGPIQIGPGEEGRLTVLLPYSPERVAKIKTVAGRRWDSKGRYWTIPHTDEALAFLLGLFAGEQVEVEPSLRPVRVRDKQEPQGALVRGPAAEATPELLDQVRQAIRTRHYSYRTEEAYIGWIRRTAAAVAGGAQPTGGPRPIVRP